jgi:putrescine aminotransferase
MLGRMAQSGHDSKGDRMTSKRTEELVQYDREHVLHAQIPLGENLGFVYDRADGIYLWDTEGKQYIDASSQMVSCNLGHGRREIIEAAQRQLDKLQHVGQYYGHTSTPMVECAMKLAEITPGDLNHFWLTSGGGEATDAATRLARRFYSATGRPAKQKVISLYMSYHGVATGPMNMTGIPAMRAGYGPESPGYVHIPAYYCYRCPFGLTYPSCDMRCARHLETVILSEGPENVAAFIAEPELGASGFLVPPDEYWPLIREICTKYDVIMIADEVMCGFCRTGRMFCIDHWDVVPDMMTMSKGITSGYLPFGAVAIGDKVWDGLQGVELMHQYTFSGTPASCAAAIAAVDVYVKEDIAKNADIVGRHIVDRIEAEFMPMPCVGTHSGLGLMLAMEIVADKETKAMFDPPVGPIMPVLDQARQNGLHLRQMGSNRIVIAPPCTTTIEEADRIVDIIKPLVAAIRPPAS